MLIRFSVENYMSFKERQIFFYGGRKKLQTSVSYCFDRN